MEIRALWSKMKFHVFYKNSSMKKIEKTSSLFKFYKIEFILWKKKKCGSSIWVTLINIDYLISRKLPYLISILFYLLWAHFCLYIFIWILVKYEAKI